MPNTFELIASSTVGSGGAANITFSSIANTYTDLVLRMSLRTNRSTNSREDLVRIEFNGSGGTAYTTRNLFGDGSSASSANFTSYAYNMVFSTNSDLSTANTFGNGDIYIPNYAGSTNKSSSIDLVSESNDATQVVAGLNAGLWSNTAAITQIKLTPNAGTAFMQHSTAYLYGVKNA